MFICCLVGHLGQIKQSCSHTELWQCCNFEICSFYPDEIYSHLRVLKMLRARPESVSQVFVIRNADCFHALKCCLVGEE